MEQFCKQNTAGKFCRVFFLAFFLPLALLAAGGGSPGSGPGELVFPYDLIDPRFCSLTPSPFVCEKCLKNGDEFVRILSFEADGRPVRTYACRHSGGN